MFESQGYVHTRPEYVFTAPQTIHPPQHDFLRASFRISMFSLFSLQSDLHYRAVSGLGRLESWCLGISVSFTGYEGWGIQLGEIWEPMNFMKKKMKNSAPTTF